MTQQKQTKEEEMQRKIENCLKQIFFTTSKVVHTIYTFCKALCIVIYKQLRPYLKKSYLYLKKQPFFPRIFSLIKRLFTHVKTIKIIILVILSILFLYWGINSIVTKDSKSNNTTKSSVGSLKLEEINKIPCDKIDLSKAKNKTQWCGLFNGNFMRIAKYDLVNGTNVYCGRMKLTSKDSCVVSVNFDSSVVSREFKKYNNLMLLIEASASIDTNSNLINLWNPVLKHIHGSQF